MEGLEPRDIILHAANVIVLFVLLRFILWRPVNKFLSQRRQLIENELAEAQNAKDEAVQQQLLYEENLSGIEEKGREIMRTSSEAAQTRAEEILVAARRDSEEYTKESRERIERERVAAVDAARREIAVLATDMASRILGREVTSFDEESAVSQFFTDYGDKTNEGVEGQ
ncbi:MAG: ATP synthase F0 subunit B [Oscillospiraceae bacterium]|jgi:F-type H+-transporting ATPase subunit b|nr:ATP synthase F0 subunit B [Oscillospiraceae bacterium]